jgi:hypothetical protein
MAGQSFTNLYPMAPAVGAQKRLSGESAICAEREPRLVARRRPPREPPIQQWRGLGRLPGAQISDDQRVLENLTLCVTAADPRQVG